MSTYLEKSNIDILFVVGGFQVGGTEKHLSLILPEIKRKGWKVAIISLGEDGDLSSAIKKAGIKIYFLNSNSKLNIPKIKGLFELYCKYRDVKKKIAELNPRIIHSFLGVPSIISSLAKIGNNNIVQIISKRNQFERDYAFMFEKNMEIFALKKADYVLVHSECVKKEIYSIGVKKEKVFLIHNGIDEKKYQFANKKKEELRTKLGLDKTIVFIQVANLIPYKGHLATIKAFSKLSKSTGEEKWKLLLVGNGDNLYIKKLKMELLDNNIKENVEFLGNRDDVPELLSVSDVGLLPSVHEGFSNSMLEYMASKLPTIATNVGGNSDAIVSGKTGYLFPVNDIDSYSEKLSIIIQDDNKRQMMGELAYKACVENFTLDKCVSKYNTVYKKILA